MIRPLLIGDEGFGQGQILQHTRLVCTTEQWSIFYNNIIEGIEHGLNRCVESLTPKNMPFQTL